MIKDLAETLLSVAASCYTFYSYSFPGITTTVKGTMEIVVFIELIVVQPTDHDMLSVSSKHDISRSQLYNTWDSTVGGICSLWGVAGAFPHVSLYSTKRMDHAEVLSPAVMYD